MSNAPSANGRCDPVADPSPGPRTRAASPKTQVTSTSVVRDNYCLLLLDTTGDKSLMVSGKRAVTVNNPGAVVVDSSSRIDGGIIVDATGDEILAGVLATAETAV